MATTQTQPVDTTTGLGAGLVWFDGKLVPEAQATVSVLTHALHYGTSVF